MIDALFPVTGTTVPADHLYPLYAALSHVVPAFHDATSKLTFAPLTGLPAGPKLLGLTPHSCLRVRLPDDRVREVLPLAGRLLDVAGHRIRLGVPSVTTLIPAATLQSRIVTFKTATRSKIDPDQFLAVARAKLTDLGVAGEASIPLALRGPWAGKPKRKVVRVHGKAIVGYALRVSGLSADDSLKLQEAGPGGRTRMGCGFFLPARG